MTTTINPTKRRSLPPVGSEPVASIGRTTPVLLRLPDVSRPEADSEASPAPSSRSPDAQTRHKSRPAVASWLIMALAAIGLLGLAYWWINRGGETNAPPIDEAPAWNGSESGETPANDRAAQPSPGKFQRSARQRVGDAHGPRTTEPAERRDRDYPAERFDLEGPDYRTSMRNMVVPPGRSPAFDGMPRHGSPKPVQPGVARLQGTIEKAPIESRYEHSRPSFY